MICSQPVILYIFFVCFVFTTRLTLQFIGVYRGHLNIKKREKRKGKKICAHQNEEARSELDCLHFSYKVQFFFSTNHSASVISTDEITGANGTRVNFAGKERKNEEKETKGNRV